MNRGTKGIGILAVAVVLALALGVAFDPSRGQTIHVALHRDAAFSKQSERRVCAACVGTGRPADTARTHSSTTHWDAEVCQWWVAATKGTSLHQDLDTAQTVLFELDNGSGLGDACLGHGVSFAGEGAELARVILDRCGALTKRSSLPDGNDRVAFPIYNIWDDRCLRPPPQATGPKGGERR